MESRDTRKQSNRGLVMLAVFVATFMTSVEVTIVTTALPSIISELHGLAYQSWIMSAYLLTAAITTPIYGKLADTMGRKRIFQFGVVVFTIGSLLSGLAPNMLMLILARALQGIGSGAVMPLTFTIIADNYDFKERAKVMAYNNTAWGLSALIGPVLGGFLVDHLSWHWVFFVNVPLGVLVLGLIWFGYSESSLANKKITIDWPGIIWLAIAIVGLLLAVQSLNASLLAAGVLLIVAIISAVLLFQTEKKVINPLISPKLFTNASFSVQVITAAMLSGLLIAYQVYFPIWMQSIYRVPATTAGLVVSSSSIMWLITAFFVGALIARFVPKRVTITISIVLLAFYVILLFAGLNFPYWMFYVIAAVNGGSIGVIISMNTILSQRFVDPAMIGSATSLLTLGRSLGQTIMTGVFGAVLNMVIEIKRQSIPMALLNRAISSNEAAIDTIILQGMHAVFAVAIILLIIVLIVNIWDPNKKVVH